MKKNYIQPQLEVVRFNVRNQLLLVSGEGDTLNATFMGDRESTDEDI